VVFRALALSLGLSLVASAAATPAAVRVCKWTGKVMARCPCPKGPQDDRVGREGCCEVRAAAAKAAPGVVHAESPGPERSPAVSVVVTIAAATSLDSARDERIAFGPAPPAPPTRRLLLI
jgi:hypothetical protein